MTIIHNTSRRQHTRTQETNSCNERRLNASSLVSSKSVVNASSSSSSSGSGSVASITWLVTETGAAWSHQSNVILARPPYGPRCTNLLISANRYRVLSFAAAGIDETSRERGIPQKVKYLVHYCKLAIVFAIFSTTSYLPARWRFIKNAASYFQLKTKNETSDAFRHLCSYLVARTKIH